MRMSVGMAMDEAKHRMDYLVARYEKAQRGYRAARSGAHIKRSADNYRLIRAVRVSWREPSRRDLLIDYDLSEYRRLPHEQYSLSRNFREVIEILHKVAEAIGTQHINDLRFDRYVEYLSQEVAVKLFGEVFPRGE